MVSGGDGVRHDLPLRVGGACCGDGGVVLPPSDISGWPTSGDAG